MKLENLNIYNLAMEIGEDVFLVCRGWNYFEKDTIGKQVVRSADSIAANISEGFGRYHYRDANRFSYIARGSLFETKTWLIKAKSRDLIENELFEKVMNKLETLGKMLNAYINTTKMNIAKEPMAEYNTMSPNPNNQIPNNQ